MKAKMNKVWNWAKEHKDEIIMASGTVVLTGIGIYCCLKMPGQNAKSAFEDIADQLECEVSKPEKIAPMLGVGKLEEALRYDDGVIELWMDKLKMEDIGKLGEGIVDNIPNVPENAEVWILMNIRERNDLDA